MADLDLTPDKATIFRITHVANVPWLLENGLHSPRSDKRDPGFRRIGNVELIMKREQRVVPIPPEGTLDEYVPFYFTPCTPMLYNIKTGYQGVEQVPLRDIVIVVSSLRRVAQDGIGFVFTDRHAYLRTAVFSSDLAKLAGLAWQDWRTRDFRRDPEDPSKMERYQAEALVHRHLPVDSLAGLACYGSTQEEFLKAEVARRGVGLKVAARPAWYP